jgi:endonuclease YncB( thermonuclease family)
MQCVKENGVWRTRSQVIASILTAAFAAICSAAQPKIVEEFRGKVVHVSDGDTIRILVGQSQVTVRLEGIDAPETGQAFSAKSKEALERLVAGKTVTVRKTGDDKYGRSLGFVLADGVEVNGRMIADGWAWHFKKYNSDERLAQLELSARSNRKGLWADSNPLAPWDFRNRQRSERSPEPGKVAAVGKFWLNTTSGVRHNAGCEYYRNTRRGRPCGSNEGKPCGKCGG